MSDTLDTMLPPAVRAARARACAAANGVLIYLHSIDNMPERSRAAWNEVDDALRDVTDSLSAWNESLESMLRPTVLDGDGRDGHNGTGPFEC